MAGFSVLLLSGEAAPVLHAVRTALDDAKLGVEQEEHLILTRDEAFSMLRAIADSELAAASSSSSSSSSTAAAAAAASAPGAGGKGAAGTGKTATASSATSGKGAVAGGKAGASTADDASTSPRAAEAAAGRTILIPEDLIERLSTSQASILIVRAAIGDGETDADAIGRDVIEELRTALGGGPSFAAAATATASGDGIRAMIREHLIAAEEDSVALGGSSSAIAASLKCAFAPATAAGAAAIRAVFEQALVRESSAREAAAEAARRATKIGDDWVSVPALLNFVFPPEQQHPRSTGRLVVFSRCGPLDAAGRLRGGFRRERAVTDSELRTMIEEVDQADIVAVYAPGAVLSAPELADLLADVREAQHAIANIGKAQAIAILQAAGVFRELSTIPTPSSSSSASSSAAGSRGAHAVGEVVVSGGRAFERIDPHLLDTHDGAVGTWSRFRDLQRAIGAARANRLQEIAAKFETVQAAAKAGRAILRLAAPPPALGHRSLSLHNVRHAASTVDVASATLATAERSLSDPTGFAVGRSTLAAAGITAINSSSSSSSGPKSAPQHDSATHTGRAMRTSLRFAQSLTREARVPGTGLGAAPTTRPRGSAVTPVEVAVKSASRASDPVLDGFLSALTSEARSSQRPPLPLHGHPSTTGRSAKGKQRGSLTATTAAAVASTSGPREAVPPGRTGFLDTSARLTGTELARAVERLQTKNMHYVSQLGVTSNHPGLTLNVRLLRFEPRDDDDGWNR